MEPIQLPLKLYPSRTKIILFLLLMAVFTVIGVFMLRAGETAGWFVAGFFGLGALAFVTMLLPDSAYLLIDFDGFEMCQLYRKHRFYWRDIKGFGMYRQGLNTFVGFSFVEGVQKQTKARRFSEALTGVEFGLPHTYGMSAEELVRLLYTVKESQQTV